MHLADQPEDDTWEDVEESEPEQSQVQSEASTITTSLSPSTSRHRKTGLKRRVVGSTRKDRVPSNLARPEDSQSKSPSKTPPNLARPAQESGIDYAKLQQQGQDALVTGAMGTGEYVVAVLKSAFSFLGTFLWILKIPFAILLALSILLFGLSILFEQLRATLSPLCIVPGMSITPLCAPRFVPQPKQQNGAHGIAPQWANFTRLAEVQGKSFGQLLEERAGGSALALEIKQAEMATADLAIAITHSQMNGRDALVENLRGFVDEAKRSSHGLQRFSAKVGGAVDQIIAVNDYAIRAIDAAEAKASERSILPWVKPPSAEAAIVQHFGMAMTVLSEQLTRLILEAEATLGELISLEERLDTLHSITKREDVALDIERDELLSALLTFFGGNKVQLRALEKNKKILEDVTLYRRAARTHVVGALQTLHGMQAEIEDLRERAATPELSGDNVPAHVHIRSIQNGIERLRDSQIRSRDNKDRAIKHILEGGHVQPEIEPEGRAGAY